MQAAQSRRVILVVDDHASLHETLHLILDDDFDVLDAQDGVTAVALVRTAPVDLVLLDILMPDVDGFQTLQKLHEAKPGLPVIVVSGLNNASTAATALRHGAVDYVTKPFQEEMLLGVIREVLRTPEPRIVAAQQALLALVGCDVRIVASLGAMLGGDISVQSYPDPPSAEALLRAGRPVLIVVDTEERGMDWLGRAALLLDRCASPPAVMLLDTRRSMEARFALGQRCFAIERPFRLAALLELVSSMLPGAPLRQPWRDARLAAVIETIAADCTTFRLRSVAARLGLSPSHLSRRFREAAGRSLTLPDTGAGSRRAPSDRAHRRNPRDRGRPGRLPRCVASLARDGEVDGPPARRISPGPARDSLSVLVVAATARGLRRHQRGLIPAEPRTAPSAAAPCR